MFFLNIPLINFNIPFFRQTHSKQSSVVSFLISTLNYTKTLKKRLLPTTNSYSRHKITIDYMNRSFFIVNL